MLHLTRLTTFLVLCGLLALALILPPRAQSHLVVEPSPTPTLTPTASPPGDLTLTGRVYDAALGATQGISGAIVSVLVCLPRAFPTRSAADGSYSLFLPGSYLNPCVEVTLEVQADGYRSLSQSVAVADLRAQPQRDFGLLPLDDIFLPYIAK